MGFDAVAKAVRVSLHQIDPHRGVFTELLVEIGGLPEIAVAADGKCGFVTIVEKRRLAHLIDDAAGGSAAEEHGSRTAQDVDVLHVEEVAVVLCNVAYAVEVDIADDRVAAQGDVVADASAFARVEGESRHV